MRIDFESKDISVHIYKKEELIRIARNYPPCLITLNFDEFNRIGDVVKEYEKQKQEAKHK